MSKTSWQKGKTPYGRRFGEPFKGPLVPFGAKVEYYQTSARDKSRRHPYEMKVLPGISIGHVLYEAGIWKEDIFVANIEELEKIDSSEIYRRRINAKEILTPPKGDNFVFSIAHGTRKLLGRYHEFRKSAQRQEQPEESEDLSGQLQRAPEGFQPTESRDDAEVQKDLSSIQSDFIYRYHNEQRVYLYVSKEKHSLFHWNTLM